VVRIGFDWKKSDEEPIESSDMQELLHGMKKPWEFYSHKKRALRNKYLQFDYVFLS
jgi:hypothetical protein